jgi:hypothetical protein
LQVPIQEYVGMKKSTALHRRIMRRDAAIKLID